MSQSHRFFKTNQLCLSRNATDGALHTFDSTSESARAGPARDQVAKLEPNTRDTGDSQTKLETA